MSENKVAITGVGGSSSAKVIADVLKPNRQGLIIVAGRSRAERLSQDLSFFCDRNIQLLPQDEEIFVKYEAKNKDQELKRAAVLKQIRENDETVVIAPASGAIKRMPSRNEYEHQIITVDKGMTLDYDDLIARLTGMGYERVDNVYGPGQIAVRGGILDVFPTDGDQPYRIELFGDEVEDIRTFDIESQRSIEKVNRVELPPIGGPGGYNKRDNNYIWDYMNDPIIFFESHDRILEQIELRNRELVNDLEYLVEREQASFDEADKITGIQDLEQSYRERDIYFLQAFAKKIEGVDTLTELRSIHHHPVTNYNNHMEALVRDLKRYIAEDYKIIISVSSDNRIKTIRELFVDEGIDDRVTLKSGSLSVGMIIPDEKLCIISDFDIFDSSKLARRKRRAAKGKPIQEFTELKSGEFVVHDNHGIGIFQGIEELKDQGITRDYIKIKYQGQGVLYVPVEQMDMVQKYIGSEGKTPKINRLGSPEWKNTKQRARRAIADMTDELIELYAKRKSERGYRFAEDTVWQAEFEDAFPYQETDDQLRSIEEIKEDMEKEEPMDRLLCGDVGYGKTEVAARAIFKCLIEGKQAAMLVPTTILANQHFETLRDRFAAYPFKIHLMSRFRTDKELTETAKGLKTGAVDLVIGTHRLLSKDVEFKDLGLLVVDEEQRFGVAHKEKIKALKTGVDVLTLSATPIPRTLNMSLTGIRDMSLISEPPEERYPVQTYVMEQDDSLIREVISRELDRGGQCFVVYNRVRGIIPIANRIKQLLPEAKVAVGHGQMSESSLEDVMKDFVEGNTDVLVATTIIESGLDIPNANTMVVLDADKCGLSQLYQLRGRVGRSNRIAYAYLMYQPEKVLTEVAEKRLKAVKEFTEFGAGFKIAMRDMELRGAGNILGAEQSGHMMEIGYEMYARLVDEAARAARGEEIVEKKTDLPIEIKSVASIPSWYIEDEPTKLSLYKRIADITSQEDAEDVRGEFQDRFGRIPAETENLILISRIRHLAQLAELARVHEVNGKIYLTLDPKKNFSPYAVMKINDDFGEKVIFHSGRDTRFELDFAPKEKLQETIRVLEDINAYRNAV